MAWRVREEVDEIEAGMYKQQERVLEGNRCDHMAKLPSCGIRKMVNKYNYYEYICTEIVLDVERNSMFTR